MNLREHFDGIIEEIERQIAAGSGLSASELAESALDACGEGDNLLVVAAAFQFLTGKALIPYIEERQMACALRALANGTSVERAVNYTSCTDPFSFAAAFEARYGIRPEKAAGEPAIPDEGPVTWERAAARTVVLEESAAAPNAQSQAEYSDFLSSVMDDLGFDMGDLDMDMGMDLGFGGAPAQAAEPEETSADEEVALRLAYGFTPTQAAAAAALGEKKSLDSRASYVMVSHLLQQFEALLQGEPLPMDELIYVYAVYDVPATRAVELVREMQAAGAPSAASEPAELINEVLNSRIPYGEARSIYTAYVNNRVDTSFEAFVQKTLELGDVNAAVEAFHDPESERILNDFFSMMQMNLEGMNFFEQKEAEMARMEQEAKDNGFRYDVVAGGADPDEFDF